MSVCEVEIAGYRSAAEILDVVRGFEFGTLPREAWTHRAHLTVALWYCLRHTWLDATRLIRDGIKKYNAANGIIMKRDRGYHETMTLFWIHMVRIYLSEMSSAECSLATLANQLIARCGDKNLPFEYYSRERLMSREARANWVEPDLKAWERGHPARSA